MYPTIKLDHLLRLTDDRGLIQFAPYSVPNPKTGYSLDDNARGIIVAVKYFQLTGDKRGLELARTYLSFVRDAQTKEGKFHNLLAYDHTWHDLESSEDSYGRALWGLGYAVAVGGEGKLSQTARHIFDQALPWLESLVSPRAKALSLLGLAHYQRANPDCRQVGEAISRLADALVAHFHNVADSEWAWFEDYLAYSNGKLPQALLLAYQSVSQEEYLSVGRRSLDFLLNVLFVDGKLDIIGNNGWHQRYGERAHFDQQPVDAGATVEVCLTAYQVLGEEKYRQLALQAFRWFFGENRVGVPLYDPQTGGCSDGLHPHGVSENQGAESTLAYLLSYLLLLESIPPAQWESYGLSIAR